MIFVITINGDASISEIELISSEFYEISRETGFWQLKSGIAGGAGTHGEGSLKRADGITCFPDFP